MNPQLSKVCKTCNIEKNLSDYCKDNTTKDKLNYSCRQCSAEKRLYYYNKARDKRLAYAKKYRLDNLEKTKLSSKNWRLNNLDKIRKIQNSWRNKNKEQFNKKRNVYLKYKKLTDINFKLACNLRNRFLQAFKNNSKNSSSIKNLGCSLSFFKNYLESKFTEGMTWENYGLYGWHIDHIIPLISFDLSNLDEVKIACHYTNMQPLWAKDNLSKNKYELKLKGDDGKN